MAANVQWAQFVDLLDIDGAKNDEVGETARTLKTILTKYMTLRFGATDIDYLVDIINAQGVINAVVTNLTNIATDDAAIKEAVAAVVPAPVP
jgi:hypothetical protein